MKISNHNKIKIKKILNNRNHNHNNKEIKVVQEVGKMEVMLIAILMMEIKLIIRMLILILIMDGVIKIKREKNNSKAVIRIIMCFLVRIL